jgi:EipB-like
LTAMAKVGVGVGVGVMIAALVGVAPAAAATGLEPHLAAYRLALHGKDSTSGLIDVEGGLVIEWRLACDGWLSRQRLSFVATTDDGPGFSHDVRFSSWESIDGSRLQYTIRSYSADGMEQEYRGDARLAPDGAGGLASFSTPEAKEVKLPPGTVFPTDHLRRLLAGAGAGVPLVSHDVFDGWGFDALTQITSAIGSPRKIEAHVGDATDGFAKRAWPISMAYYNVEHPTDTPEFEASFLLGENGVLRDLILDYGDFSLDAKLEKLELLDRPKC